jgi:hypothetical protein
MKNQEERFYWEGVVDSAIQGFKLEDSLCENLDFDYSVGINDNKVVVTIGFDDNEYENETIVLNIPNQLKDVYIETLEAISLLKRISQSIESGDYGKEDPDDRRERMNDNY